MKAIIVDDEPKAIDLLKGYLAHFSSIELIASFRNGLKALEYCGKNRVDLVFLDINMPQLTGLSLSRMLPRETKVIFTTAHAEFAVDSYDVEAADYLLKPISLERFAKAIGKIMEQPATKEKLAAQGFDLAPVAPPAAMTKLIQDDLAKWPAIIKAAGAKVD